MGRSPVCWISLALLVSAATLLATAELGDDSAAIRLTLALATSATLLAGRLLPRRRVSEPAIQARLLAVLALAGTLHAAGPDLWRFTTSPWVRAWNVFHYYLGSEYFDELGYTDLYLAALAADREGGNRWRGIERVRNLRTSAIEPRTAAEVGYLPRDHFAPERWRRFKADLAALEPQLSPRTWRSVLRDRGYNATPAWTALVRPLTRLLPARRPAALKALVALDLLLLAATFWQLARTFGLRTASLVLLFFVLSPINRERLVGGVLQYDWFSALALALCWLKRWRPHAAAAALAWATLARIFPLAPTGSTLLPALARWVRRGRLPTGTVRFALAFGLLCAAGVGLGLGTERGAGAWREFAADIGRHNQEHVFGEQRVGLKHLFTHDLTSLSPRENQAERRRTFARQRLAYLAAAASMLLLYAAAVLRRNRTDAYLLGMVPFFVLVVASRYYGSGLALFAAATAPGPGGRRRGDLLAVAQAAVLTAFYAYDLGRPSPYAAYLTWNLLVGALLLVSTVLYLRQDWRVLRRAYSSPTQSARAARRPVARSTSST